MTPSTLAELERLTSSPDPEGACQDCGNYFTVRPGDEPSAMCHHCAQNFIAEHVPALIRAAREAERLREQVAVLREALTEIESLCRTNSGEVARFVAEPGRIGDFFALVIRKINQEALAATAPKDPTA